MRDRLDELHAIYRQTGDQEARAELLHAYRGLASALAARMSRRREDAEEISQVALLGLLRAIDRFDPERGIRFSTFAWATIRGEIKRHHRDRSWGMHVPRGLQEQYLRTAAAIDELTQTLGRSPTIAEIAAHTGDGDEAVVEAIEVRNAHSLLSLDAPAADAERAAGQLADEHDGLSEVDERRLLSPLVARLGERERRILHLRFVDDLTQAEIAVRVGLSQMHVSRLLSQSLSRMRQWAREEVS